MKESQSKDQSIFVVGLLAAFLAFSPFKEELGSITILNSPKGPVSLLTLLLIFIIILTLSVYLHALDYQKYNFGVIFQNFFLFKWVSALANFFYSAAVLFPILVLIVLIAQNVIQNPTINDNATAFISIIGAFLNILFAVSKHTSDRNNDVQHLKKKIDIYTENASKLFKDEYYTACIIESYRIFEILLRASLLKRGILTQNTPIHSIERLAQEKNIIPSNELNNFRILKEMRNRAVHLDVSFSKEDAVLAMDIMQKLVKNLDN